MTKENRTLTEAAAVEKAVTNHSIEKAIDSHKKDPKVAAKSHTLFVSREKENVSFDIRAGGQVLKAFRDKSGQHLVFRVPNKIVPDFSNHPFVKSKRLVLAEADSE